MNNFNTINSYFKKRIILLFLSKFCDILKFMIKFIIHNSFSKSSTQIFYITLKFIYFFTVIKVQSFMINHFKTFTTYTNTNKTSSLNIRG